MIDVMCTRFSILVILISFSQSHGGFIAFLGVAVPAFQYSKEIDLREYIISTLLVHLNFFQFHETGQEKKKMECCSSKS